MSSYRSYRPWSSSQSSYSSSSNYRSRYGSDGTTSASTSTASKFSSITPSSYRPSYSSTSGTYRASRAPPISSTIPKVTPTYTRTYSSLGKPAEEESKSKSYTRTYTTLGRDKPSEDEKDKPKSYTRSYTTLGRTKVSDEKEPEKKEPSPPKRTTSRFGSTKDLTTETRNRLTSSYTPAKKEEKGPPITFNTRYKVTPTTRGRSRDPSPTTDNSTSSQPQTALQRLTAKRELSRERSPSNKTISAVTRLTATRSRDPSPVATSYTDSALDKYGSSRSYSSSTLRPKPKTSEALKEPTKSSSGTGLSYTDRLSTREKSYDQNSSLSRRPSITSLTSTLSRSRDPSPVDSKYNSLSSYRISNGAEKSREPSPSITLSRAKLRESSPVSAYRRPSREPSPSESLSKYGSGSSGFMSAATSKTYGGKTSLSSYSTPKAPDISVSYMSTSEANTRPSRISYINRHSPQKDKVTSASQIPLRNESPKTPVPVSVKTQKESESESSEEETTSSEEDESDESAEKAAPPATKIMIQVTTITRSTSPTPPSSSSSRIRRNEIAKMIEKVRQRPLQGPPTSDQSTQSDRMDDSTRYSRFGSLATTSHVSYSPSPTSYSSRYKSDLSTSRYTRESSENPSVASTEKSESSEKSSQKSDKANFLLPNSEPTINKSSSSVSSNSRTTTASSSTNDSLSSRISISKERAKLSSSKSKTSESEKSLPPQSPTKSDSPKVTPKVSNKDFRKSALNMGPTDRVRRSKSSSSENSSPTVEKTRLQFQQLLNGANKPETTIERSSSVESESSTESLEVESQIEQKHPEPTKEEIISHKIEEAKSFLLKTLGNPAAHSSMKSPSPLSELHEESLSQTLNTEPLNSQQTTSKSLGLDFSKLEKAVSGERAWWMDDSKSDSRGSTKNCSPDNRSSEKSNNNGTVTLQEDESKLTNGFSEMTLKTTQADSKKYSWLNGNPINLKLERVASGEKAWWCKSPENKTTSDNQTFAQNVDNTRNNNMWEQETQADISEIQQDDEYPGSNYRLSPMPIKVEAPLGDRAEPEGLESNLIDRKSDYDNANGGNYQKDKLQDFNARPRLFISRHTNIDDLLGGSSVFKQTAYDFELITPDAVKIHDSNSPPKIVKTIKSVDNGNHNMNGSKQIDDAAIQVYRDGDLGAYLDLESSLAEQSDDIEGLNACRKNALVVRTQLSVRVHSIIDKLLTSDGRELRRALFSLKQIFQEDKDLVHGFVALGGLNCLVQIGNEADQNYQNYILRALGQVMLYVDGMNGVMNNTQTIQWLYTLIASKYRLVVKTALKLLLVFVEYCENNCYLLVNAIRTVDNSRGTLPWTNIMKLLRDYENADTELLIYAASLINKTLSGLNDQDSFYDETDYLEEQGMESIIQRYMSRADTDLDLLDQFQLYDAALRFEDGVSDDIIHYPDNVMRKTLRYCSSETVEKRKSRRQSTTAPPPIPPPLPSYQIIPPIVPPLPLSYMLKQNHQNAENDSSSSGGDLNGFNDCKVREGGAGVTPGLRRRRERAERQKSFQREQESFANGLKQKEDNNDDDTENDDAKVLLHLKREQTVKDLTQKLSNLPLSPQEEKPNRVGDLSGLISKAKEELAKSKSKGDVKTSIENELKKPETKKSEIEMHWEELIKNMDRDLTLCDLDFRDLTEEDEINVLMPRGLIGSSIPPPPPPNGMMQNGPPPPIRLPPTQTNGDSNRKTSNEDLNKKTKKTVKLFWKEVREDMIPSTVERTIWDELPTANVDTTKLEHLFESRAKDMLTKEKQQELNKSKEIIVLDHKRSNAINIAMTKLPPPRAIKAAILKMDSTVVTREGIEKLLNMLPTDEERGKILEAQMQYGNELPLGSAEQFLLTLSSISELTARLQLWAFRLDFENIEKEIAEPLMDLKQGVELLKANLTFKCILSHLLTVGCFLNGQPVKGFQIEYLSKVPEVKDTVHKHSLLHHLCHWVMESSPNTTDLYSEIGPITRASKADFNELAVNIKYLETECKASWDRLKLISKHDTSQQLKQKLIDFLADCAERIIILEIVHRRVINRYNKFLLWLGAPPHRITETRPNEFCRILSEFALEYRTTRERVHQQIEKKTNHRERNKTRGKLIVDVGKFKTGGSTNVVSKEEKKDAELRQLLGSADIQDPEMNGTFTFRRRTRPDIRSPSIISNRDDSNLTDGDDEILESLVKATKQTTPRPVQRERKRTRHADRKSFKRSRTREGFAAQRSPSPV